MNSQQDDKHIRRLVRMLGADPAFYLLSLHAYMEMQLNIRLDIDEDGVHYYHYSFSDKLYLLRQSIISASPVGKIRGIGHFDRINKQHVLTNRTRHNFADITLEEARAGTWSFLEFCRICGIDSNELQKLRDNLDIWESGDSAVERYNELRKIRFSLHLKDLEIRELNQSLLELSRDEQRISALEAELKARDMRIAGLERESEHQTHAIDELKSQRSKLSEELGELKKNRPDLTAIREYREQFLRLSDYTRTRRDYERSIARLSEEQLEVLDALPQEGHALIRGGAGTGKTVVLLESLRRLFRQQQLFSDDKVLLLTFANTLVKYDRYIGLILGIGESSLRILTVDRYVASLLAEVLPEGEIRYGSFLAESIAEALDEFPEAGELGLESRELELEIDALIWGHMLSRREYVDERYRRSGLKGRLGDSQRALLWDFQELIRGRLEQQQLYTRNLALVYLLEYWPDTLGHTDGATSRRKSQADPSFQGKLQTLSALYIDEVQDLPPVVLRLLSLLSPRLVMAGDIDQSIYGLGSPFARAGVDIRGRSHMLNRNFRNSIPILEFSECYRRESGLEELYRADSPRRCPQAFRDGPPVGLYASENTEELRQELLARVRVFLELFDYEAENICIICPDNRQVDLCARAIRSNLGIEARSIRDPGFEFGNPLEQHTDVAAGSQPPQSAVSVHAPGGGASGKAVTEHWKGVRLSPIHSAKGLDFPVVFLFLPFLNAPAGLDERQQDLQRKHLLYVGLTRAMDHLEIFTTKAALRNPVIAPLQKVAQGLQRDSKDERDTGS